MDLFRKEVLRRRDESLTGPLIVSRTVSWAVVGAYILAATTLACVTLGVASYPTSATATGVVQLDGGATRVVAPRAGNVYATRVSDGDLVHVGQAIFSFSSNEVGRDGLVAVEAGSNALTAEEAMIRTKRKAIESKYLVETGTFQITRQQLELSLQMAKERREDLETLYSKMKQSLDFAKQVALRGFVSQQDINRREEALLSLKESIADLKQKTSSDLSDLKRNEQQKQTALAEHSDAVSELFASQAKLKQAKADLDFRQGYELDADRAGIIRNIEVRPGDYVPAGSTLAVITPASGGTWMVKMEMDARSVTLAHVGSGVVIALDAFPSNEYGYLSGSITHLDSFPNSQKEMRHPVYVAYATIAVRDKARGRYNFKLLEGMQAHVTISSGDISVFDRLGHPSLWFRQL